MFGFFKKKIPVNDAHFESELVKFASDFAPVIQAMDPQGEHEMIRRTLSNYYERTSEEVGNSASDFYFDAFTGAMFELTQNSIISPQDSLPSFSMVDTFLRGHGIYQTPFTLQLMDNWQNMLFEFGAIKISSTGIQG